MFFDYGGNSIITVNINEYTINTEHKRFWTWPDCENTSNNYIDDSDNNLFRFFPNYKNDGKWNINKEIINNLYFQTNDPSELEHENNIANKKPYAFTS